MSELLTKMKSDLAKAGKQELKFRKENLTSGTMYDTVITTKNVVREVISMFPSLGIKPDKATDKDTIQLLKQLIYMERTRQLYQQKFLTEADVKDLAPKQLTKLTKEKIKELGDKVNSFKVLIAMSYLPKEASASPEEIKAWIKDNIDFSIFKNKMQAMGPIMKHFAGADGNEVKTILLSL